MKRLTMKRVLSVMLVMILTLLPGITMTAYAADVVSYVYYTQDGNTAIRHTDGSRSTYTTVTDSTTSWSNGWYVVNSNVTVSNRISVTGTVYLILCDGYKLTAKAGITVTGNNHLVIYGQDAGTGALQATGSNGYSGIGGGQSQAGGKLTIHGGNVNASCSSWASGIGGGYGKAGGTTTIYGGTVTVSSAGWAAAIGGSTTQGGANRGAGGTTLIYGGTVTATSNYEDAAIGGGRYAAGGITKIYGGNVTATSKGSNGTGIGGGQDGAGGTTEIHGGNVTVTGSGAGAGIGGCGSTAGGGTTIIDGGTVIATGGASAAGIGSGNASTTQGTLNIASDMVVRAGTSSANLPCLDYPDTRSRYAKIWPHNHSSISYSVSGNTLTGTCSETNCNFVNNQFTLLVNADDAVYDGTPHGGTLATGNLLHGLTEIKEITGLTLADSDITFWQGETKLSGVPVNVGVYTAKLTVNLDGTDYTIFKEYNIKPTVTYDANGGTGAPVDSNSPYLPNATVTVLEPGEMAYSGFAFAGWNTEKNGTGTDYVPGDTFTVSESTILYAQWGYCVTITAGSGMTKTTASGDATQTIVAGAAMTDVVYTANEGYYFPTDYSVTDVNGISVTRDSYTQITVSGTPTANAEITLTAATAKENQSTPDATGITVTNAINATSADGVISGVTSAMEYSLDGTAWTAVTGTTITGLNPGSVQIRFAGDDTHNASNAVTVTVGNQLEAAQTTAKNALDTLLGEKTEADYDADDWTTLTQAITNGKTAIDNATTIDGVTTEKTNTVTTVNAIKTKAEKLAGAKTAAKADLDTLLGEKTEADFDADDWTTLTQAITNGKTAIDNATTIDGVTAEKTNTVTAVNAIKTKAEKVEDAINALPDFSDVTTANKDAIEAARAAYNALTDVQKERVPADTLKKLNDAEDKLVVLQAMSEVSAKTGRDMTYTGNPIQLINTPTTALPEGYTMKYAVTTENTDPDASAYTTDIPQKTDAGTYYVWYMVKGDENHLDYVAETPIEVTIKPLPAPEIIGHSLVLTGSIGVRFYVALPGEEWMNYSTCRMTFKLPGEEESRTMSLSDAEKVSITQNGETITCAVFTCYVNAVQMADEITVRLEYTAMLNGSPLPETEPVTETYSARQYIRAFRAAGKAYDAKTRSLVRALAEYGYYAQLYLSKIRGWKLGAEEENPVHVAMDDYGYTPASYTDADREAAKTALAKYAISVKRSSKIEKVSFSLYLDSDTALHLYFTPAASYKGGAAATVDGAAAEVTPAGQYLHREAGERRADDDREGLRAFLRLCDPE